MGNACSCLTGLDHHQHDHHHHAVRYGDVPKYAGPCERLQQVQAVSMSGLQQKNSGSPRKGREAAPSLAIDQSDTQQLDEQQPHWHSPNAAEQQQQHQQYLQQAGGGVDAEQQQLEEEQEVPTVPFSWTKGELIGIGAFGRVYTALNNETGELVAVKQVSFAKDEALQGRVAEHIRALEAEVDVLKTLKHENIVRYLGTERTGDALHIFLEYVPGGSIASLLTRFGAFPEPVIRAYTAQLLRGLEYLHARGIMHRDIKGANILIDKHGTVKLADFGASKKIEDLATVGSGSTSIRGTPYWMAPEVIKQTGHGRPADIWSLACTVIEMATGKPPWSNLYSQPVSAMFHIASSKDPPKLPDHLSPEAKDFLMLCFNRVARDRANATRLLKHPFVTKAQLPQTLPFPASSSSAANSGSPAGQRGGGSQGRSHLSSVAVGGSTPQQSRDGRQAHTPPGARHSAGMQPAFASNGSSSLRPSAVSAAALAASNKARCSPPSNAHGSPRRQQQPQQQQQQHHQQGGASEQQGVNASPGSACSGAAGGGLSQRGDASAVVTAMRPQQATPGKQQEEGPMFKQQQQLQQQQQQGRQSPRPFEQQQQQAQQQQQQQQQQAEQRQQQGRRSITPRSAAEAAAAAAGSGGGGHQDSNCMTLVDWNPMVEPSWMPGSYQVPGGRRDKPGASEQQQQQQHGSGRGSSNGSRQQPNSTAADPPDALTPIRQSGASGSSMGLTPSSSAAAAHMKRGNPGSSILSAAPGSSTRSNGGIGSRKLEGSGPLASGPVGRASRENLFGSAGAAAAVAAGSNGAGAAGSSGVGAAGSSGGRLGSSRAWGTGLTAAAGASPGGQQLAGGGSASGGSPARSMSAASGSGCDADGCEDSTPPAARANSSSTGTGSGPLLQQADGRRLSSSGSYGRSSSQQGVADAAMVQLSSKHAQWEQELFEELARQREEHRASRAQAGGHASRRSALQQQ